jgi:hypothetical protein
VRPRAVGGEGMEERFHCLCGAVRLPFDEAPSRPCGGDELRLAMEAAEGLVARVRSTGLRVTKGTVPSIARSIERVHASLGLEEMPEVYVVADPTLNAKAVWAGGLRRSFVIMHSGLARLLAGNEYDFVLGHELGHLGLGHSVRKLTSDDTLEASEAGVLRARLADRAAELSADRVGLVAARSLSTAARVVMKVASGLPNEQLGMDADAFLSQLETGALDVEWEVSATHPGLPLRLWALQRFAYSDAFGRLAECATQGRPLLEVDRDVESRLRSESTDRLAQLENERIERALFWLVFTEAALGRSPARAPGMLALVDSRFGARLRGQGERFLADFGPEGVLGKLGEQLEGVLVHGHWVRVRIHDEFHRIMGGASPQSRHPAVDEALERLRAR